jgi:hypothetical protein
VVSPPVQTAPDGAVHEYAVALLDIGPAVGRFTAPADVSVAISIPMVTTNASHPRMTTERHAVLGVCMCNSSEEHGARARRRAVWVEQLQVAPNQLGSAHGAGRWLRESAPLFSRRSRLNGAGVNAADGWPALHFP